MDELEKYYNYLKSKGAKVPDTYQSFRSTLQNEDYAQKYYTYLKSKNFNTPPTYESFANTLGIKKKVGGNGVTTTAQTTPNVVTTTSPQSVSEVPSTLNQIPRITDNAQPITMQEYGKRTQEGIELKSEEDKLEAATNTAKIWAENNPMEFKGLSLSPKNKTPENKKEKFSLTQLSKIPAFNQKVAEIKNNIDADKYTTYTTPTGEKRAGVKSDWVKDFTSGVSEAWNADKKTNEYLNASDDKKIELIEKGLEDKSYLPLKPDVGSGAYQGGAMIPGAAKMIAAGFTGGVMAAAVPETAGISMAGLPALLAWASITPDMAKQTQMQTEIDAYQKLMAENPNRNKKEALKEAKKIGIVGYAEGLVTGTGMMMLGQTTIPKGAGQGLWKATGEFLRNQPQSIAEVGGGSLALSALGDVAKRGMGLDVKDAEMWDKAGKSMSSNAIMQLGFNVFHGVIGGTKAMKSQAKQLMKEVDPETLRQLQEQAVQHGVLTQEQVNEANKDLSEYKKAESKIPANQKTDETRTGVIAGLIQKKNNLEEAKKNVDPVYHKELDQQIEAANQRIELAKNSKDPLKYAEQDDITGEPLFNTKSFEELSKSEREGIDVPKDYGEIEIIEKGEGENKNYSAKVTLTSKEGLSKPTIKLEENTFNDKSKAKDAAENALREHYYDNGMLGNLKPEKKSSVTVIRPTVEPKGITALMPEQVGKPKIIELEKEIKGNEIIPTQTDEGTTTGNEPITAKEGGIAETKPIETVQGTNEIINKGIKNTNNYEQFRKAASKDDIEIKLVPLNEIEKYIHVNRKENPKAEDYAIKALAKDIKENGWREPIQFSYDGEHGIIEEGNTRIQAAKELGLKEIPVWFDKQKKAHPNEDGDFIPLINFTKKDLPIETVQGENITSPINKEQENAIQEQTTGESLLRNEGVQRESGLQGVEQRDQSQEPTGTQEKIPQPLPDGNEEKIGGITQAANAPRRAETGLGEYKPERETFKQWDKEGQQLLKEKYNGNVDNLIKELEDNPKRTRTPQENAILKNYISALDAEIEKAPTPDLLARKRKFAQVLSASNSEAGRQLVSIKGIGEADNLADFLLNEAESLGIKPESMPEEMIADLKSRYDEEKSLKEQIDAAYVQGREDAIKEQAEAELKKRQAAKTKSEKRDYKTEIKSEIEKARDALKKIRTGESGITAVPLPGVRELIAIAPHVKKAFEILVDAGAKKIEEVVKELHTQFKDLVDNLQEKDIYAIISGEHDVKKQPTVSEARQTMRDMKEEIRLLNELNRARKGEEKTLTQKVNKTRRIQELRDKIKEVRKRNKEREIEEEGVHDASLENEEKIKNMALSIERGIKKLQEDYKAGKYKEPRPHRKIIKLPPKVQALEDKFITMQRQDAIRRSKYEYDRLPKLAKIADKVYQILGIRRFINAGVDFSVPFRQANPLVMNPLKWLPTKGIRGEYEMNTVPKAFANMFNLAFSPKKFERFQYSLERSELGRLFQELGGVFSNPSEVKMDKREEEFTNNLFSRIGQKIEVGDNETLKKIAKTADKIWFSERAAAGFLNTARIMEFAKDVKELERQGLTIEHDPKAYKDAVKMIMNETGRGNLLGALENSHDARVLTNRAYFGARLMAAKINLLNPATYAKLTPEVRTRAFKDMAGAVSGYILTGAALAAAGAKISFDYNDPEFLQARFDDKVYDITGGSAAYVRTFLRLMEGVYRNISAPGAKATKSYNRYAGTSIMKTLVTNKLSPNTSYLYHFWSGKSGEYTEEGHLKSFDPYEIFKIYPLYADDLVKGLKEEGMLSILTVLFPQIFGFGFNQYPAKTGNATPKTKSSSSKAVQYN